MERFTFYVICSGYYNNDTMTFGYISQVALCGSVAQLAESSVCVQGPGLKSRSGHVLFPAM